MTGHALETGLPGVTVERWDAEPRFYLLKEQGRPTLELGSVTNAIGSGMPNDDLLGWYAREERNVTIARAHAALERSHWQRSDLSTFARSVKALTGSGYHGEVIRDREADVGTQAHEAIERRLQGEIWNRPELYPDPMQLDPRARIAYDAFLQWWFLNDLEVLELERPVWSRTLAVAGTYDATLVRDGVPILTDWKTSARLRSSHLIQLGAYRRLARECYGQEHPVGLILKLPKQRGHSVEERWIQGEEFDALEQGFVLAAEWSKWRRIHGVG